MAMKGANLKALMADELLPPALASADFRFFVEFAMRKLEKHHEGKPRVRVFAHALAACATPEQWAEWEPWVRGALSPELYEEIAPLLAVPFVWQPFGSALPERGAMDHP
jgi:hypothetical protein